MDASSSLSLLALVTILSLLHSATTDAAAGLPAARPSHRRLLLLHQPDTNLAALPPPARVHVVPVDVHVPSHGTGSFPAASPGPDGGEAAPATPATAAYLSRSMRWLYMVAVPAFALLALAGLACWLLCRKSAVATIGPWKTGLSGQLQKAFVTGTSTIV